MAKSKYTTLRNQAGGFAKTGNATDASLSDVQNETLDTLKQLNVEKAKGQKIDEALRDDLIKKLKLYRDELKLRKEARDVVQEQVDGLDEVLSIGEKIKHNISKVQKISSKTADGFAQMGYQAASIASKIEQQAYQTKEGAKAARDGVKQMESYSSTVTKAMREFKTGKIDADQLTSRIKYAGEEMESFLDTLDLSNSEMRELYNSIKLSSDAAQNLNKSFAEGKQALKDMKKGIGEIASSAGSGIPGVSGLVSALSSIGTVGMIGAIAGITLALSELVGYVRDVMGIKGLSGMSKVGIEMKYEMAMGIASLNEGLAKTTMQLGQSIQLSGTMKANMVKLGVSADDFTEATTKASNNLGLMGKDAQTAGADIAMYSKRTGASADDLDKISNSFRIVGDLSGKSAVNTLGMAESVAKTAGLPVNALFKDLAESSELFLQNNYGNEKSMIKQVATLRVMGLAAQKVLQAGQKMVLNYKDSIKSEMQLSALMGKQIDLSRVRQKFASGDTPGAMLALQEQLKGIDLNKMNAFQRQSLQDATGMDMDTIMKTGKGGKGGKLETDQQKMVGSITNLQTALIGSMDKYWKDGISIAGLSAAAATALWDANAAKKQAELQANADKNLDEAKNKLGDILIALGLVLAGAAAYKLAGPLLKKLGTKVTTKVAGAFGRKAVGEVAETGVKKFSQKQILSGFAGKEARDVALKSAGKSAATKVATAGVKTAVKTTSTLAKLGKGLLKGGAIGILGTAASMAGEHFGGEREAQGMQEADRGKVNQGKALKAGATALEYGGYGAAIGSVVPVIGTAVGGAIGGVIGGIKGVFDNWFSEDAKKQEALLKEAEEKKKADAEAAKLQKELGEAEKIINGGEEIFRAALMAQLLEVTRLLDILAIEADSDFTGNSQVYLDGKKITSGLYNKASALYAANSQTKP